MLDIQEYEVIGAVLVHGRDCLHKISDVLKPEHLRNFELSEAYKAMLRLDIMGNEISPATVIRELGQLLTPEQKLEMATATQAVISIGALRDNAKAIADRWKFDKACEIATCFGQDTYDDVNQYIAMYADMLNSLAADGDHEGVKPWADVLTRAKKEMFQPISEERIRFGLPGLDRILGGTDPTDLMLIAARPAVGKTALKEQLIRNWAKQGKYVLNVSLEMPDQQIAERQTAALSGVSLSNIRDRIAAQAGTDIEREKIEIAIDDMKDWKIDVWDNPSLTPSRLSRIVRMKRYDIVVVDYGGLLQPDNARQNRVEEMSQVSRAMRALALGQRIQVVVLLQLNRQVEGRSSKRVLLSDLRETGQWEQDGSQVVGMSPYGDPEGGKVLLEVLKNRNGPCGTQIVAFDKPQMTFMELEERYVESQAKLTRGMDV